ncbi:hypothetical protein [Nocardia sp. CA-135398]|uniref:hypothetical protein n=1 Tax=Nocardia sp. CA-135398 TaxID=3239977 RepID=UPI003D972050
MGEQATTAWRGAARERFVTDLAALRTRSGLSAGKVSQWIRQRRNRSVSAATISDWFKPDPRIPRGDEDFGLVLECLHTAASLPWPGTAQAHWRRLRAAAYAESRSATGTEGLAADRDQVVVKALSETPAGVAASDLALVAAERDPQLGLPLAEVVDPFLLEVHEPITADRAGEHQSVLPPYVRRVHDDRLAVVVGRAVAGESGVAILLGGSSTGKTRALWEALAPLREQGGWRLWHPRFPTRRQDFDECLSRVGPRTVLWLNETQRYLPVSSPEERERAATALSRLLTDPRCGPVLILGSLWREHYNTLCTDAVSETRKLLNGVIIDVPPTFTGTDLEAMRRASGSDARLALACESAEGGQITQYLAGGPELIDRYRRQVSVSAQAVIEVAMDALRLGHPNTLPFTLLRDAAAAYIPDTVWDGLGENWFELALAETSRNCKGARGPITLIRDRPLSSGTSRAARRSGVSVVGEPVYQLADYLEQFGRSERANLIPPIGFWEAAAAHTQPNHQHTFADAASDRGLYRDAAQLWKNATGHGEIEAARSLVAKLHALFHNDHRPAAWAAAHVALDDPLEVAGLLDQFQRVGAEEQVSALAERAAAHFVLDDPQRVALLLERLRKVGTEEKLPVLLARDPATHVALNDPYWVARLLGVLWEVGAEEQVRVLAGRAAVHVALDNPDGVAELLDGLREVGAEELAEVLAGRAAAHITLDSYNVTVLLDGLRAFGAEVQVGVLAERAAVHVALDNPERVARLLGALSAVGAEEQVRVLLARDPAVHVVLDDPTGLAELLGVLSEVGAEEQVGVLAERAAVHVGLDNPAGVARLLDGLWEVGAEELVGVLAERAATHVAVDDPYRVAVLLRGLRAAGAEEQVGVLAERAATHIALDNPERVAVLLRGLRAAGAEEQVGVLAERAATHIALDNPYKVAVLLGGLRAAGAEELVGVLAERAATHVALDNPYRVAVLLGGLRELGAEEQVRVLLARDPAARVTLDQSEEVAMLLGALRWVGAEEQVRVLLARDPAAHVTLDQSEEVATLLGGLRAAGAEEQIATICGRLPAAGMFELYLDTSPELKKQLLFGREPDGTPAEAWSWSDLA